MYKILVDFSHLGDFSGFGEISRNYAPRLAALQLTDIRFVFLVKDEFVGKYGNSVDYVSLKHFNRWKEMNIDLWHATDQQHRYRGYRKGMKQLLTVHDLNFLYEKHGIHKLKWKYLLKRRVNKSDAIACISHYVKDNLLKFMKVNAPIDVIYGIYDSGKIDESYDFKMYTPWKFGVSVGHTISNYIALGATYEYSDYRHINSRINTGGGYDWYYDSYYETSDADAAMNDHADYSLKGVSTLKLGAELKATDNLAFRLGFNYVSPMYQDYAYKNATLDSPGSYYASTTDYTNWKSTYRLTCGVGYNIGRFNLDATYQYSQQEGGFMPFMNYFGNASETPDVNDNVCNELTVNNKRHQLLFTLGYRF